MFAGSLAVSEHSAVFLTLVSSADRKDVDLCE